jgi:hypothetical protein
VTERLESRLAELREELEGGRRILADLELREAETRETLLRISGAVQVLEELVESGQTNGASPEKPAEAEP